MIKPAKAWMAAHTARWHSGDMAAHLAHTNDTVGGHSARMAIMAMRLFPNDFDLVKACLTHDLGEHGVGDMALNAKREHEPLYEHIQTLERKHIEALGFDCDDLDYATEDKLYFLDRLDAYYWVSVKAPHLLSEPEWVEAEKRLIEYAHGWEVLNKIMDWHNICYDDMAGAED